VLFIVTYSSWTLTNPHSLFSHQHFCIFPILSGWIFHFQLRKNLGVGFYDYHSLRETGSYFVTKYDGAARNVAHRYAIANTRCRFLRA